MNVSSEFVNWLLIAGSAIFAAAMWFNYLALVEVRRRARRAAHNLKADSALSGEQASAR